jgi:hypothetical protein
MGRTEAPLTNLLLEANQTRRPGVDGGGRAWAGGDERWTGGRGARRGGQGGRK